MKSIIRDLKAFQEAARLFSKTQSLSVGGLWDSSKAVLVSCAISETCLSTLVLTSGPAEAEKIYRDLCFFSDVPCLFFPAWETLPHEKIAPHIDIVAQRFSTLEKLLNLSFPCLVVAPVQAVLHRLPDPEDFKGLLRFLHLDLVISMRDLMELWVHLGYRRQRVVENRGEFAVRGGILDVFSPQEDVPVRIEFEGNRISSMRKFDVSSQISQCEVKEVRILPACELELASTAPQTLGRDMRWGNLMDYFSHEMFLTYEEESSIDQKVKEILADVPSKSHEYEGFDFLRAQKKLFLSEMPFDELDASADETVCKNLQIQRAVSWRSFEAKADGILGYRSELFSRIGDHVKAGTTVHFVSRKKAEGARIREIMEEKGIWNTSRCRLIEGDLSSGFILPEDKWAILTDEEIFGKIQVRSVLTPVKRGIPVREYTELSNGDYVVHLNYGIGRYLGVSRLNERKIQGEFLTIEYDCGAKLYVPIDQIELIERYVGIKGHVPKLNRLGGKDWGKSKIKALGALQDYAAELLQLQAKREMLKGKACGPDTPWQKEFEESFIYPETPDQITAIEEMKKDLESTKPMDRLICGDVGFGKTEVAIRGAFKVVMEGRQVAVLVPTTILAQQHLYTFRERFSGFPVEIEMLSRFRSPAEQKEILKELKEGRVDIIIGTHRLLGADVVFKDLGLVVVDEEQRFGVAHKEKFKRLRTLVDVLTLTATPIPRTLYLSLTRSRDMSLINTPPQDRFPIETHLTHADDRLIRDAIVREIARDGQVFYVHNRVMSIYRVRDKLKKLVPSARFAVAHGQMAEDELEEVMREFIEGQVQVLVSTNIVESGLDVPNANTIIIDHAEWFGLSDLYQLRGRVGRYKRRAYAYLLYSNDAILLREAKMRLKAIQDFSDLGSGFKVAMRDLEIRGAGNILGRQQHGHISAIGFQLYCRLLDETVRRLKGEKVRESYPVSLQLGFDVSLPMDYISEPSLRMEFYRRIAEAPSKDEMHKLTNELIDRFGPLPREVALLVEISQIKALARRSGLTSILLIRDKIFFRQGENIKRVERSQGSTDPLQCVAFLKNVLKEMPPCGSLKKPIRSK